MVERIAKIYRENARESARRAEAQFRDATTGVPLATVYQAAEGDMARVLAEQARFVDLLILGQHDTENPRGISAFLLPQRVVLDAGTPILVVPLRGAFEALPRHALVAWDGSPEATRALRDAMPLLRAAERVSLLAVDPDRQGHVHPHANSVEVAARLGRHGITTEPIEVASGTQDVTDVLLAHAAQVGADLLVMGAYGHSPIKEFILGGTTQDLLARATIPILISH